jgi:hypothetical protein
MSALQSFRRALGALGRNPVLFLGGLAFAVVALPSVGLSAAQQAGAVDPAVGSVLGLGLGVLALLARQFTIAGIVGMADESLDGATSFGRFTDDGTEHYLATLLATIVRILVEVGVGVVFGIVGIVVFLVVIGSVGAAVGAGGGADAILGALGAGTVVVVVALVVAVVATFLLLSLLFAFYAPAIVIDGDGPLDAVRSSIGVVRANKLNAVGFLAIEIAVGVVAALPTTGLAVYRAVRQFQAVDAAGADPGAGGASAAATASLSTPETLALSAITFATTMLVAPIHWTFATAFYRDHRERDGVGADSTATADTGDEAAASEWDDPDPESGSVDF